MRHIISTKGRAIMRLSIFMLPVFLIAFELNIVHPTPKIDDLNYNKVLLGKRLFTDTRLSGDGSISCSSCHLGNEFGVDHKSLPIGIRGQKGSLNSPTTLNARYNFVQFWDGRARSLEEQALGPIQNPIEMDNTVENVLLLIKKDNYYKAMFKELFNGEIDATNLADAIAEFERALVTYSRFDRFLEGDKNALSQREQKGYRLFKEYGCIACHNGVNLGGNLYQKFGLYKPYKQDFVGRYGVSGKEEDMYLLKVPTLKNIHYTYPYFHDGREANLLNVIRDMSEYQSGIVMKKEDAEDINLFLNTLSGDIPEIAK